MPVSVMLPASDNLEFLVQERKPPGALTLALPSIEIMIVGAEAVDRVRRREIGPGLDLGASDHLVKPRVPRVSGAVDDVQVRLRTPGRIR